MGTNCPVGLICRDIVRIDSIQHCEARFRSPCFGNRRCVSSSRAECRRYADQLFIEDGDGGPVNPASARPLSMYGLNRRFKLKAPGRSLAERLGEMALCL